MKVAALGYYGFGNLGDEAVLSGIRTALATEPTFDGAQFVVLSNSPGATTSLHPGVLAANRWKLREAATALTGTNLFILGGGSLLQDATSVKSVIWYALMARIARAKSKRVLWWGQGIGPLRSNVSRFLVRHMANQADAITVRDEKSAELLKVVGAKGSIETVADPAFALTPKPWQEIHSQTGQGVRATDYALGGDHLIFAVRTWKNNDFLERVGCDESLGQQMKAATGSSAVADFRMHPSEEAALPGSVSSSPIWRWDQGDASIEQVINVFATAKMVVAMRLHALIFAARCGVPFVALSYDPKVDALASACGQEDALLNVNDTSLTRDRLLETITRVRDTDTQRRVTLNEFAMVQGERARRPAAVAANLLS